MSSRLIDRNAGRLLLVGTLALAVGCADGGHGHSKKKYGPPIYDEIEPNDSPYTPDFIGVVHQSSHFFVDGHVQSWDGFDTWDHFEFEALEPTEIEFFLHGYAPGADLDLCVWDPDLEVVVACWDGPWNPEEGAFQIDFSGKRFVIAIDAYLVDSSYSLEILGYPPTYGPGASDSDSDLDAEASASTGISFPDGVPAPTKDKHRPGGPAVDEREREFPALAEAARNAD